MTGRNIARYQPIERRKAMVVGITPQEAMAKLKRKAAHGLVAEAGAQPGLIRVGPLAGQYGIPYWEIIRVLEPEPVVFWTRGKKKAAAIGGVLAVFGGLIWWVIATITATALAVLLGTVLLGFGLFVRRAMTVEMTTTTTTRVKVRR